MKKLLFTVIALIAMNVVSMANTIELERNKIEILTTVSSTTGIIDPAGIEKVCALSAAATIAQCEPCDFLSPTSYAKLFRSLVNACVYSLSTVLN